MTEKDQARKICKTKLIIIFFKNDRNNYMFTNKGNLYWLNETYDQFLLRRWENQAIVWSLLS